MTLLLRLSLSLARNPREFMQLSAKSRQFFRERFSAQAEKQGPVTRLASSTARDELKIGERVTLAGRFGDFALLKTSQERKREEEGEREKCIGETSIISRVARYPSDIELNRVNNSA